MLKYLNISLSFVMCLLFVGWGIQAFAQGVTVNARLDRTEITVGDRVNLDISITADTTLDIVLPPTEDLLGVFEVKDYQSKDPFINDQGRREYHYWFDMTTWTTGRWLVPPLTVTFTDSLGQSGSASSDSLFINVKSLLAEAGADTVDIRDLKAQYSVPPQRSIFYVIAGAAVILAALAWYILRRRRRKIAALIEDTRTVWERAFDELTALRNSNCLAEQQWREWYFSLTEIYRRYLDGRYGVETLEATTTEVKLILPSLPLGPAERETTVKFLDLADLVKFARLVPPPDRPQRDFDWVWQFVEQTKLEALISGEQQQDAAKTGTEG